MSGTTTIYPFLQARNLRSLAVQGGSPDATTGVITWGTASDLAAQATAGTRTFKAFDWESNPSTELIRPSDLPTANYVIEYEDFDITIQEIIPANGSGVLGVMLMGFDYFRVVAGYAPRGATAVVATVAAVGIRGSGKGAVGPGENVQSLQLKPIGSNLYIGPPNSIPF